ATRGQRLVDAGVQVVGVAVLEVLQDVGEGVVALAPGLTGEPVSVEFRQRALDVGPGDGRVEGEGPDRIREDAATGKSPAGPGEVHIDAFVGLTDAVAQRQEAGRALFQGDGDRLLQRQVARRPVRTIDAGRHWRHVLDRRLDR